MVTKFDLKVKKRQKQIELKRFFLDVLLYMAF